ncbi:hypothetical protein FA95DRAFT_1613583 [Auriscalpium vulgare]|uniref:Uncharacterized protein n=1 Tax=Auriscalpium vulgare TaxID=40419 RepID=A0ACB8R2T3_9AGAM|nr:hypothetical protein FA95DRAFT_1613583 [Auriscalpium vulgare]
MEELEMELDELKMALDEHADLLAQRDEEKETGRAAPAVGGRTAESIEHSQNCAMILEEQEERHVAEDDLNTLRDKLAAASIELRQQKEDEDGVKSEEISELTDKHWSIVDDIEGEWKGEVDEAKTQNADRERVSRT